MWVSGRNLGLSEWSDGVGEVLLGYERSDVDLQD